MNESKRKIEPVSSKRFTPVPGKLPRQLLAQMRNPPVRIGGSSPEPTTGCRSPFPERDAVRWSPSQDECGRRWACRSRRQPRFSAVAAAKCCWSIYGFATVAAKLVSRRGRGAQALNRARPVARGRCRSGRRPGLSFGWCSTISGPPPSGIPFSKRCARARSQTWRLTGFWGRTRCS